MSMLNVYILYITYILSLIVYLLVSASVFLTFVHISKVSNHFSYNILKWDRSHDYKCAISKIKIFREKNFLFKELFCHRIFQFQSQVVRNSFFSSKVDGNILLVQSLLERSFCNNDLYRSFV